jgi:hypothetical protein
MSNDKCPYCRHVPFFSDLRKFYHDECMCKICNEDCIEQYAGPCGHVLCNKCIDKIQKQINGLDYTVFNYINNVPPTLYTCIMCRETNNKSKYSRRQRRKSNNFLCKDCTA